MLLFDGLGQVMATLNNNYLGMEMEGQEYSPGYQPNYYLHYEQYNHTHHHHHWYSYQNNYYQRQWYY